MVESMSSPRPRKPDLDEAEISARDAAEYCFYMAREMARIAQRQGLDRLAFALEHVWTIAEHELRANGGAPRDQENPAPDNAA